MTVEEIYRRLHDRLPKPGRWGRQYVGPCLSCDSRPAKYAGQCTACNAWRQKFRANGGLMVLAHKDGRIMPDRLVDVVRQGRQEVWEITTQSGRSIVATADHRHLTPEGWRRVSELRIGDQLLEMGEYQPYLTPRQYTPLDVRLAVLERSNGQCERCGSHKYVEFAHLDSDTRNNRPSNVAYLCSSCHKFLDYHTGSRKQRWSKGRPAVRSRIVGITNRGVRETYDVEMAGDDHSWVGNGIVTHNSHATAYGLLAYRTAWLVYHYPGQFWEGMIIAHSGDDEKVALYTKALAARRFTRMPVDVNTSGQAIRVDPHSHHIYPSLTSIKGIGTAIAAAVEANAPYDSLPDLVEKLSTTRVSGIKDLMAGTPPRDCSGAIGLLAKAGALRSIT